MLIELRASCLLLWRPGLNRSMCFMGRTKCLLLLIFSQSSQEEAEYTKIDPILNGHGPFYLLVLFRLGLVSWIFIKLFQTFFEVKADINRVILTSCSFNSDKCCLALGGAKDSHFYYFERSCQKGSKRSLILS